MAQTPTFAIRPSFLGVERTSADAAICVAGIPFDLGTSNRPGARFAPAAIRQASRMLVAGDHPASWAWGHGSPFYHAIEEGLVDPRNMIQIGIRSPLHRDIFDWTVGKGVTIVTAEDVHERGP